MLHFRPESAGRPVDSPANGVLSLDFGQIAQLVERSPEKAGVGGSSPSLATTSPPLQIVLDVRLRPWGDRLKAWFVRECPWMSAVIR
jgi:hypothetical protein